MKKRFLPKAWMWQKYFSDDKTKNKSFVEFYVRLGRWMSSDMIGVVKEEIYILPCLSFHFNHSEIGVLFGWLIFQCWFRYKSWKREDAYIDKIRKRNTTVEMI